MALGQELALPFSSSLEPLWRATRVSTSALAGSGTAIGEAAARAARSGTAKNFMVKVGGLVIEAGVNCSNLDERKK
jgi:hypothetical protein